MNNERYNQIIEEVGRKYTKWWYDNAIPSSNGKPKLDGEGILTRGEFINKIKTDDEFAKTWGLKIEERELSLEERLKIADKFNPLIREDCLTKTHHPDETDELKLVYRHEWLDSLGPNVVPQRKLITLTYNNKKIESYE